MSTEGNRLIDQIDLPADLRTLSPALLRQVAQEIRAEIIETVAGNGGHLGPSLGVVELAIALHAELDTPRDILIWDVGHQCYAHKLLTGRLASFRSIRTYGGLSGFPCRDESTFDPYGTGHSSTSISAAVGIAEALRSKNLGKDGHSNIKPPKVVAVIGDGALTGGLAYEALNHAGHLKTPILVVLNDNAMAIEKNVGAVSAYLSRLRTEPTLYRLRRDLETMLQRLPGVGERMVALGEHLKDVIKAALVPGMLFEELGFTYVGVVDGHDVEEIRASIRRCLSLDGPVLLHCCTVKGKGYGPAERQPGRYHRTTRFAVQTGEPLDSEGPMSFTRAFGEALVQLAWADDRVVGITAAMATDTGLDLLKQVMPDRFFDVGIAEEHAVALAAGMAAAGKRPVVAIYSTFLQRAFDQIIHDVCLQRLPVVFAVDRAGLVGADGPTHHGAFDISYLRIIPGLTIFAPKDEGELQRLLATALKLDAPVAIRYPRGAGMGVPLARPITPMEGPWIEVMRQGSEVLFLSVGPIFRVAEEAAAALAEEGISATTATVQRVRPLDLDLLLPLLQTHQAIVTVEDNVLAGGFGSLILETMAEQGLHRPVARAGLPDAFVPHGPVETLRQQVGLTGQALAEKAKQILTRCSKQTQYA